MKKIMIVEDDLITATVLEEHLQELGYEVVGVLTSGEEAVEVATDLSPDIVIMDIVLPGGIDGITAAERIRCNFDGLIVFITGHREKEYVERAKKIQTHGYILKPFSPYQVETTIELAIHKKKIEDELKQAYDVMEGMVKDRTADLETSNQQLKALLNAPPDSMALIDLSGNVLAANPITAKRYGMTIDDFMGICAYDLMPSKLAKARKQNVEKVVTNGKPYRFTDERNGIIFDSSFYPVFDHSGKVIQIAVCGRDITKQVNAYNQLKESKKDLQSKTDLLEQANTALKIMLQKSSENREEVEEEVLTNLNKLVMPCISRMKGCKIDEEAEEYLQLLKSNLKLMASPFSKKLTFEYLSLSPKEIRVANLIRSDKTTKEIAEELKVSKATVEFHRNNIREKFGIKNKKTRLKSYLLSL